MTTFQSPALFWSSPCARVEEKLPGPHSTAAWRRAGCLCLQSPRAICLICNISEEMRNSAHDFVMHMVIKVLHCNYDVIKLWDALQDAIAAHLHN